MRRWKSFLELLGLRAQHLLETMCYGKPADMLGNRQLDRPDAVHVAGNTAVDALHQTLASRRQRKTVELIQQWVAVRRLRLFLSSTVQRAVMKWRLR